jgi:hypothetical protein
VVDRPLFFLLAIFTSSLHAQHLDSVWLLSQDNIDRDGGDKRDNTEKVMGMELCLVVMYKIK